MEPFPQDTHIHQMIQSLENSDSNIDPNSISGILRSEQKFSKFYKMLKISGLEKKLSEHNPEVKYTIFVPHNNSPFFLRHTNENFHISNKGIITTIIESCIVTNIIDYRSLKNSNGLILNTVNLTVKLNTQLKNDEVFINDTILVENSEIIGSNGVVHTISDLIDPYFFMKDYTILLQ